MPLASSQWVEQNFLPAGAIHVQAMWAHLIGVFDMEILPYASLRTFGSRRLECDTFYSLPRSPSQALISRAPVLRCKQSITQFGRRLQLFARAAGMIAFAFESRHVLRVFADSRAILLP